MPNDVRSFWKDEAKLDLLSPEKRWHGYIRNSAKMIPSVGGLAIVIARTSADPILLGGLVALMVYPCYAIAELFWKGGEAGAKLMDRVGSLGDTAEAAPASASEVRDALHVMADAFQSQLGANPQQWDGILHKAGEFITYALTRPKVAEYEMDKRTHMQQGSSNDAKGQVNNCIGWMRTASTAITESDIRKGCTSVELARWSESNA